MRKPGLRIAVRYSDPSYLLWYISIVMVSCVGWPSRSALPARSPSRVNSAARSLRRLRHSQQRSHLFRVEPLLHDEAPAVPQANFNTRVARNRRALGYFNFQESCRRTFPQPFLPHKEIRSAQTTLTAERNHRLPATRLLRNQPSPLRPCLLCALGHVATLRCDGIFHKMGFV